MKPVLTQRDYQEAARLLSCEVATIKAVAEVGSAGAGFLASESAHLMAFCNFIKNAGLLRALQRKAWPVFAHGYNWPLYKRRGYDTGMAMAYKKYSK